MNRVDLLPRPRCLRGVAPMLALLASAPGAGAQHLVPTMALGGSIVRYADSVSSSAATISPSLRLDGDRVTLGAGGTFAQSAHGWSTQGDVQTSLYSPAAGLLLGEINGSGGGSAHEDGSRTGQALVVGRAHLMAARQGVWAGAGMGTTWDGASWHPVRLAEIGAWSYAGVATMLATVTPTTVADTIRYTDAELGLRLDLPRAEIGVGGGLRAGDQLPTIGGNAHGWGSVSITGWLAPATAVVASAGSYPVDFTQGFPGGRFVSLGVRFGPRTSHRSSVTDEVPRLRSAVEGADARPVEITPETVIALRVVDGSSGQRAVRVHAPRATTVEIMGDFTGWAPVRMVPAGAGWWTTTLPIEAGAHQMNVRASGGAWAVPPGLTSVQDEFGGVVGVLVVADRS